VWQYFFGTRLTLQSFSRNRLNYGNALGASPHVLNVPLNKVETGGVRNSSATFQRINTRSFFSITSQFPTEPFPFQRGQPSLP